MIRNLVILAVAVVAISSSILWAIDQGQESSQALNFELSDTNGVPVNHKMLWGKWSVVTFGFTHCPDVCPTHAAQIADSLYTLEFDERLSSIAEDRVQAIFISVDYLRDTSQVLDQYLKFFHPKYIGLIGDAQQLDRVSDTFKVAYSVDKQDDNSVEVWHSSLIYITNPYGRIAKRLPFGASSDLIVSELESLM